MKTLIGQIFGQLTVQSFSHLDASKRSYWFCYCSCGKEKLVRRDALISNKTLSCGCYGIKRSIVVHTTHGLSRSPTYHSWQAMHQRCTNSKAKSYIDYGARGVTVCSEWESFEVFFADMGERPLNTTLERTDVHGPYDKNNCVWATIEQQNFNRRNSIVVVFGGKKINLAEYARLSGIRYGTLHRCFKKGKLAHLSAEYLNK